MVKIAPLEFLPEVVSQSPAPTGCCRPPHPKVTTKDDSVPCWRYSPCKTEYHFYDREGLTKRDKLTHVSYNEKAITFFAKEKFISYSNMWGEFAKPIEETSTSTCNATKYKANVNMLLSFISHERKQRQTGAIINACEETAFNTYATYYDDGRRCINVDLPVDHPVYLFFLRILQLQIDLGIADPGTVIVNAFGNTGIIIMQKMKQLNDQMVHTDCPSDEKEDGEGHIPYLATTTDSFARKNYKPEIGDGCLSCFVTLGTREDYLGNPGQGFHCLPTYSSTVVGGNCLHNGTGNDRGEDEWKLFAHFDSPGFNRGKNLVRDRVFVSAMYSIIRQNFPPYTHCSRMMLWKYVCQGGCGQMRYNYYTYPYCNGCLQHKFHVKLVCVKLVHEDEACRDCAVLDRKKGDMCMHCIENNNTCARYSFLARYTGTKTLREGDDFNGMEISGGVIVTRERYNYLHRDLQGKMIDAIQVSEGEDPLFLDCTQLKTCLAYFQQSSVIENCNLRLVLDRHNAIRVVVRRKIKNTNILRLFNPGKLKLSSEMLTEFNIDCKKTINQRVTCHVKYYDVF